MKTKNQMTSKQANIQVSSLWSKSVQACRNCVARMAELRNELMTRLAEEAKSRLSESLVHRALTEAEALADSTQYPLLFLPALAEEKILIARQRAERQREILKRQRTLAGMF